VGRWWSSLRFENFPPDATREQTNDKTAKLRQDAALEKLFEIIHEDAELLVINKPADLVCHPSKNGEMSSLIGRVRLHLGGDARPHLVNRLDRETSGVTLVAKTDSAARELRQLWEKRDVRKEYVAIVHGHVCEDRGMIDAPLAKDEYSRVAIKDCVRRDGAQSQTEFEVERRFVRSEGKFSLLRVLPCTGRKHQIRIHLAHLGHAIVGDKLYGSDEDAYLAMVESRLTPEQRAVLIFPNHALHARALRFEWRGRPVEFLCEPEKWFSDFVAEKSHESRR
jgi:23S rRNA pseudouridine1911/1915/1917 synthase